MERFHAFKAPFFHPIFASGRRRRVVFYTSEAFQERSINRSTKPINSGTAEWFSLTDIPEQALAPPDTGQALDERVEQRIEQFEQIGGCCE
ncbi:MAG TPA: hypothetical protein VJA40_05935 [archaeon]|nr:hypothetical protein [archaeon]